MSIGNRFAFNDAAETPNVHIAFLDYQPVPIICEIRNVQATKASPMGKCRNAERGIVIVCEGGHFSGDYTGGTVFDNKGAKVKEFKDGRSTRELEVAHIANFIAAIRSRKTGSLNAESQVGHVSAACCHMANVSHRLGKQTSPDGIRETIKANPTLSDAFDRCREYLRENGVDLGKTPAVLGPWVTFDEASKHYRRKDRAPFVVPEITS